MERKTLLLCCLHPELATPRDMATVGAVCMEMSLSSCGRKFCCFCFMVGLWKYAQTKIVCSKSYYMKQAWIVKESI